MPAFRFEDLEVGARHSEIVEFSAERLADFGRVIDDRAPVHVDEVFARSMGFHGVVVHGLHLIARFSGILGNHLPGPNSVIHSLKAEVPHPVYVGDRVTYTVTVQRVVPSVKTVVLQLDAVNADGRQVVRGTAQCGLLREGPLPAQTH